MVYKFLRGIVYRLQSRCLLCECAMRKPSTIFGLCENCLSAMPEKGYCCQRCGLPTAADIDECGECLQNTPYYQQIVFCTPYNHDIQKLIIQLKQLHDMACCRLLADYMADSYCRQIPALPVLHALLPVPMHKRRLLQRGNNHSQLLAQKLAKRLSVPLYKHWLVKVRNTPAQRRLTAKQRRTNLRNAFMVKADVQGKNIAIVDDVMTTGSTVNEIAKVLKKAGANAVYVLVIARA